MFFRRKFKTLNLIELDPEALLHNLRVHQEARPNLDFCQVLKSNAYGHGLCHIAKILDKENLQYFIVDSLYEAEQLKNARIKTPILILGYTNPENFTKKHNFHFAVFDKESLLLHSKLGHSVHIEIDTGMNRMGFKDEELKEAFEIAKKLKTKVVGIFSHFATADESDETFLKKQEESFKKALVLCKEAGLNPKFIHIGNSAGSLKSSLQDVNMARLGIGIYGIEICEETKDHLKNVANVKSEIVAIKTLEKDESISYGRIFTAQEKMRIAVIPFGYYEGLPRSLSNNGHIQVLGKDCKILGRVCMNHTMIDISNSHFDELKIGEKVYVYSASKTSLSSFTEQTKRADTISHELMVRLNGNIRREIKA